MQELSSRVVSGGKGQNLSYVSILASSGRLGVAVDVVVVIAEAAPPRAMPPKIQ